MNTSTTAAAPDALGLYLSELEAFPLLSPHEERELAGQARSGDQRAKHRLIEHNLRLVIDIAKHYQHKGLDLEDLISEGNAGLIRAVETFDPEKGRLTTYATHWIKQHIRRALDNTGRLIRLPSYQHARLAHLVRINAYLAEESGDDPSLTELAESMGLNPVAVSELVRIDAPLISLDQPVTPRDETPLAELLPDRASPAIDEVLLETETQATLTAQVHAVLGTLTQREQQVIRLRFGLDGTPTHTLLEIGQRLGLSKERVRQLLQTTLGKLYHQCLCTPSSITLIALPHAS